MNSLSSEAAVRSVGAKGRAGAKRSGAKNGCDSDLAVKEQRLCELEGELTVAEARIQELEQTCHELATSADQVPSAVLEQAPIGYLVLNEGDHITDSNAYASLLLGYETPRLRQFLFKFFVYRDDLRIFYEHLSRARHEPGKKIATELRLQTKERRVIPVQMISIAVQEKGKLLCRTLMVDLTEQHSAQQSLAEAKEFAESIVETVREPLAVLDADLRMVSVNRAFAEYFKCSAGYLRDRPFEVVLNLWWSGHRLRAELERVLVKNQPLENFRLDVEVTHLGNRTLFLNARRLNRKTDSPANLLVTLEDVTERRRAEEARRLLSEELEKRVAERTEDLQKSYKQMESFCYSIAHDLRAPLRTMVGFSELLADVFGEQMGEMGRDYTDRILQSGKRMDRMILDLLDYGRLNTIHLPLEEIDLDSIFEDILARHSKDIEERGAIVEKPRCLPRACGHRVVLEVAMTNLLSNALKFVAPGVQPKINIWPEERGSYIRIYIQDNGIGIPPESVNKIFGVFQRLHSSESYSGTGIGLALVNKGVERIGGRVGVESRSGVGSRFWIELPKQKQNDAPIGQ